MRAQKNYQKMLEATIAGLKEQNRVPTLLLHSCCAPCSSAVLERLTDWFDLTVFYYNPNIAPEEEFLRRAEEQRRLIAELPHAHEIQFRCGEYESEAFEALARGLEDMPEGGERCTRCFRLRLGKTAALAAREGFDYFTTTLSISPLKDAQRLNAIGGELAEQFGVAYLFSDFKKKNGYKRSCELSVQYDLYRQDYCGCRFSQMEREKKKITEELSTGI